MNKNINIINVSAYYPPHIGGIERVAQEISEQLAKDGYSTTVLTSDVGAKNLPRLEVAPHLTIKRLWSFNFAHTAFIPSLCWQLTRVSKPAIFHLHLAHAYVAEVVWLVSKLRGIPYIAHFHLDVGPSGPLGWLFLIYKRIFWGMFLKGSKKVIVFSDEQLNIVHTKYGVKKENIVIIPNGVGENFFTRNIRNNFNNPLRILSVGRLDIQKRPERLIEAVSLLKIPAELTFVGDGDLRQKLEMLISKLELNNVKFVGKKFDDELRSYYRNSDVFVISSDHEGMPLVVLEAMAGGLPIIGSDVLGNKELIKGTGILVNEPYAEGFANAITRLFNNPEELQKLSKQSLEKAEQYSWKKLVNKLEEVYQNV